MSRTHFKRIGIITFFLLALGLAATLILYALKQNINLFYAPAQIHAKAVPLNKQIRIGGMVQKGSLQREEKLKVSFAITDFAFSVWVEYQGLLPDLFRENQGVVATGYLTENNKFIATEILAKHDENYMPPEALSALQKTP